MTPPKTRSFWMLALPLLCGSPVAGAARFRMELEPVAGYERAQKTIPTTRTRNRLVYGARISFGVPWISLETEYLGSTDRESFPSSGLSTKDVTDRVKVGTRVSMNLTRGIAFSLRGGGQASRNRHTEASPVATTTTNDPTLYKPYFGAGLTASLGRSFALRVDATTVFRSFPSFLAAQYQLTTGLLIRFP